MFDKIVEKTKREFKRYTPEILASVAIAATLASVYYYGKSKGELTVEMYLRPAPDAPYKQFAKLK
jgi:hypothetical protein